MGWGPPAEAGWVFGGALLAQSLHAASTRVPAERLPHTLAISFLRAGDVEQPVDYASTTLNDTRRFSSIRVEAHQARGIIASAIVGFHEYEPSPSHDEPAPAHWTGPDEAEPAPSRDALPLTGSAIRDSFDLRRADRIGPQTDDVPHRAFWVRTRDRLGDAPIDNAASLAWVSDFAMTHVADVPHLGTPGTRLATSLNHAIWFHRPPVADEWLLYDVRSPVYRGGLALSHGRFFDQAGQLIATTMQESLLRRRAPAPVTG